MAFSFKDSILSKLAQVCLIVLSLFLVGLATKPLEAPAWEHVKAGQPEMNLEEIEGALGQGLIVGVLGGFRTLLADLLWLQTNSVWEQRDRVKLDTMVRLVTSLDPRPELFWVNSSRMIAYDVPSWRIRKEGGHFIVPEIRQREIDQEQAEQAFDLLDRALKFHPEKAKFYLEKAMIYLNRLKDDAKAAEYFLIASEKKDAPYYAARIYAQLLRKQGYDTEAYAYLKALYQRLPNDDPYAQKDIVLERIQNLEAELRIPYAERFQLDLEVAE